MNNRTVLVLTKQSSQPEIKAYFEGIIRLANGNEQFPVNLDEVWPLVYAAKNKAVSTLNESFVEGEDFIKVNQKVGLTKQTSHTYFLSLSCLEYFIARKVRPVFEVYRQVFHKAAQPRQLTQSEMLLQSVQLMIENEKRVSQLANKVDEIDARTKTRPGWFTIVGYATLKGVPCGLQLAGGLGRRASQLCKQRGIEPDVIPDPRFGRVKVYPPDILEQVFDQPFN